MKRTYVCLLIGALAAGTSQNAFGVVAKNTTTNEVLFDSQGLEADTPGNPPSATAIGSWNPYYQDAVVTGGAPGAYSGSNYLYTLRDANGAGGPEAHFAANQDFAGDEIVIEWAMYVGSGGDEALILHNPDTYYRGLGRVTGGTYYNYNGAGYIDMGLPYTPDTWQVWTLSYVIGAANYTISVGGNSVSPPTLNGIGTLGGGSLDGLYFGHNGYDVYYIDAVPEPASLMLLALGGISLLARRRMVAA